MALSEKAKDTIDNLLDQNKVVLFMKGTPQTPMCGFSASASGILNSIVPTYATFNVLEDEEVREGIKEYSNWPTIPQLYIDKELMGGSDIITQMFNSGELHEVLGMEKPDRTPPQVNVTDAAAEAIGANMVDQPGLGLHFKIDDHWRSQFTLQPVNGDEIKAESNGIVLHMDIMTAQKARGVEIDWVETIQGTGLSISIPDAPPAVQEISPTDAKERWQKGELTLVDVRPENQRQVASLADVMVLDKEGMQSVNALPKDTPIAFLCHIGKSSLGVAEHYRKEGFTQLYSVSGGIDAWSQQLDPSIPRY